MDCRAETLLARRRPSLGADTTKRIFSLLAHLIALRTQSQDLAITPTARTIQ